MKKFLSLLTALLIISTLAFAQEEATEKSMPANYRGKYTLPGFKKDWHFQRYKNWVISNIVYPQAAIDAKIEGQVAVAFIIDEDGVVRNAECVMTPDSLLSNELIRVVKSGKWERPAKQWNDEKQRYEAVKMRSVIPIMFNLPAERPESNDHLTYGMMKSSFSEF